MQTKSKKRLWKFLFLRDEITCLSNIRVYKRQCLVALPFKLQRIEHFCASGGFVI